MHRISIELEKCPKHKFVIELKYMCAPACEWSFNSLGNLLPGYMSMVY
jgi:hypothetical protein